MASPDESIPFLLTERGERNLAKTARHCTVPTKGGARDWNVAPVLTVIDEHPWGWSQWVIPRERYLDADAVLHWGQHELLPQFLDLVRITVIDPSQVVVNSRGDVQPVTAVLPRGRRERRRAGFGAGIAALPAAGMGTFAAVSYEGVFGTVFGAGSAVALTAMGGMIALSTGRSKGARSGWVSTDPDFRKPWLPMLPHRRPAAAAEPNMPHELYVAIARTVMVWADTRALVTAIPALTKLHAGAHERMYTALGAAPSWSSHDLPTVIDQLHRYCDLIEKHEATYERDQECIERERQLAEPPAQTPLEVNLQTDDAEDDLQLHEQQLQAYEDLQSYVDDGEAGTESRDR